MSKEEFYCISNRAFLLTLLSPNERQEGHLLPLPPSLACLRSSAIRELELSHNKVFKRAIEVSLPGEIMNLNKVRTNKKL